jgi:sigma-E factor negative regulatory protein RseA
MRESLSALIDGELSGGEFRGQLGRLRTDIQLRDAWDTYHLIGDALRGHVSEEIASHVFARLRDEPTVLVPRRPAASLRRVTWYAMSAAASVAAVALVVWTASPLWHAEPQVATAPAETGGDAVSAVAIATDPKLAVTSAEVENYLLAHQPYSHTSAMQGIAPYVRTVADESGAAGK